jgi:polar amino acid transport system permease protein
MQRYEVDPELIYRDNRVTSLIMKKWFKDYIWFIMYSGAVVGAISFTVGNLDYDWQWNRIPAYVVSIQNGLKPGPLLHGVYITVQISLVSIVFAFLFGLVSALLRMSDSFVARLISYGYVESIRNTPLIVQIFFMYFAVAPIFNISAFASAVTALSLFEGAYLSEIIRAGILSIRKGQWEAAWSLGLGRFQTYRYVILPLAMRRVLPPLTGQGVSLIKDSALVSTISIYDLTMVGQSIVSDTFLSFEVWFTVAALYLMMTVPLSLLSGHVERKFAVH